jgi:hypothetical protein
MMEHEHDSPGNALRAMCEASNGYSAPPDLWVSYQTLKGVDLSHGSALWLRLLIRGRHLCQECRELVRPRVLGSKVLNFLETKEHAVSPLNSKDLPKTRTFSKSQFPAAT